MVQIILSTKPKQIMAKESWLVVPMGEGELSRMDGQFGVSGYKRLYLEWMGNGFLLFSLEAVPIYIPTNTVAGFPFLYTLSSICYL